MYIYFFFYENFTFFFLFSSIGSMLIGSIGAIQQKKFRRLLAYSSITATGYYLMLFLFPDLSLIKNIFFFIIVYFCRDDLLEGNTSILACDSIKLSSRKTSAE